MGANELTGRPARRRPATPSSAFVIRRCATGLGLFAARHILPGRWLVEYTGPRLTEAEARRRRGRYLVEIGDGSYLDGSGRDNLARYVNHSCAPNCAYVLSS